MTLERLPADVERRAAQTAERAALRDLHHRAYRDLIERQFGGWDAQRADRYFEETWAAGGIETVLIDGHVSGYCVIRVSPDGIDVDELVVDPAWQNCGIGTAILRHAMEMAAGRGAAVLLRTAKLNRAADLYRRLGFRETGEDETHLFFEWRGHRGGAQRAT